MVQLLPKSDLHLLIDRLLQEYVVVAPVVRDQAIVFTEIASAREIAVGFREEKAPGRSTVVPSGDGTVFGHFNGANSVKGFLHPSHQPLFSGPIRGNGGSEVSPEAVRMAFVGLRPCDVAAVDVLDRVFREPADVRYHSRRRESLIVEANCTSYGATCFCTSVGTGPRAKSGYDIALTELETGFLVEAGSDRGERLVQSLGLREAREEEIAAGRDRVDRAAREMPVRFNGATVSADLWNDPDHPVWGETAARCLGCTNCTQACPTCFCYTIQEVPEMAGAGFSRERVWDSCFSLDFAAVHGGNFRPGLRERYRHWVTHKLSTWVDQFDVLGCVGCGRCITWCPTAIDISEVAGRIQRSPSPVRAEGRGAG